MQGDDLAKGIASPLADHPDVHHVAWSSAWHKDCQAVQMPHPMPAVRQTFNGDRALRHLWLDLGASFVYLLASSCHTSTRE